MANKALSSFISLVQPYMFESPEPESNSEPEDTDQLEDQPRSPQSATE